MKIHPIKTLKINDIGVLLNSIIPHNTSEYKDLNYNTLIIKSHCLPDTQNSPRLKGNKLHTSFHLRQPSMNFTEIIRTQSMIALLYLQKVLVSSVLIFLNNNYYR